MAQKIRIIGVPMDLGQSRRGVDMGPSALRVAGLQSGRVARCCAVSERYPQRAWVLPDDAVRSSPVLSVFYGYLLMISGDLDGFEARLDDASLSARAS